MRNNFKNKILKAFLLHQILIYPSIKVFTKTFKREKKIEKARVKLPPTVQIETYYRSLQLGISVPILEEVNNKLIIYLSDYEFQPSYFLILCFLVLFLYLI